MEGLVARCRAGRADLVRYGAFAANDIEANVERSVHAQLQARGFGWVAMKVSGQEVLLAGTPPAPGAGEAALGAARATACATWAGPQICAVTVLRRSMRLAHRRRGRHAAA
ncbi:MAG: hypothetical protein U1F49_16015 [Rubrivivax sp.]